MLSNLDRKTRFFILAGVAIVATTAIIVGITVPAAKASDRSISNASGTAAGDTTHGSNPEPSGGGTDSVGAMPSDVSCPCFTPDQLHKAMVDIISNSPNFEFDQSTICTGDENRDGMEYNEKPDGVDFIVPVGFSFDFSDPDELQCTEGDAIHIIDATEAEGCKAIMRAKCADHQESLSAMTAIAVELINANCPCFSGEDMEPAMTQVLAGDLSLHQSSCVVNVNRPDELTISYNIIEGGHNAYHAFGVGSLATEKSCQLDDMNHLISADEHSACKAIMVSQCARLE